MSSREAFEQWAKDEGYRVFSDARGSYGIPSTNCAWESWKAATERAAVCAWTTGMDTHKGILEDPREIGSKCARAIREGNE